MFRRLFAGTAKLLFLCASSFFVAGFCVLAFGCFLATWPFVHGSPLRRRVPAAVNLLSAIMEFISTMPNPKSAMVDVMRAAQDAAIAVDNENDAPNV